VPAEPHEERPVDRVRCLHSHVHIQLPERRMRGLHLWGMRWIEKPIFEQGRMRTAVQTKYQRWVTYWFLIHVTHSSYKYKLEFTQKNERIYLHFTSAFTAKRSEVSKSACGEPLEKGRCLASFNRFSYNHVSFPCTLERGLRVDIFSFCGFLLKPLRTEVYKFK
jgi:hypothetical protein